MASFNQVCILGNLGRDPELRAMPSGDSVVNFSIATNRKWKDKSSNATREETTWHRCTAFGRAADVIAEYARKGDQLMISGRLQTRKWADKDGNDRESTEIVVNEFQLLGQRRRDDDGPRKQDDDSPRRPRNTAQQGAFDDMDDDILF